MEVLLGKLIGLNFWSVMFRLLLAAVFGGCIGLERGRHNRAAGLRTHILVCVGAAVTVLVGLYAASNLRLGNDPLRIGAQVISGIGFLGAGTILHHDQTHVTGLTTAAGLWTTACIGLAIGAGAYWIAAFAFLILMIAVVVLGRMECFGKKTNTDAYYLEVDNISFVNEVSDRIGAWMDNVSHGMEIIPAKSGLVPHVGIVLTITDHCKEQALLQYIRALEHIVAVIPVNV